MQYTVRSTMPTGNKSDKFGEEYYVQFEETDQAFPLWFKSQPESGKTIEGEVVNGKFKKIKKEYTPGPKQSDAPTRGFKKDNSDGMRQGMCMNNAAAYINTLEFDQALTPERWSEMVYSYANALYLKGDLGKETQPEVPHNVAEVFGPGATPLDEN